EPEPREVGPGRGGEVRAAALDPDRAALATEVIGLDELGRGVSAAVENERGIGADQSRARDEPIELRLPCIHRSPVTTGVLNPRLRPRRQPEAAWRSTPPRAPTRRSLCVRSRRGTRPARPVAAGARRR